MTQQCVYKGLSVKEKLGTMQEAIMFHIITKNVRKGQVHNHVTAAIFSPHNLTPHASYGRDTV